MTLEEQFAVLRFDFAVKTALIYGIYAAVVIAIVCWRFRG